jgi:hypothetical protein
MKLLMTLPLLVLLTGCWKTIPDFPTVPDSFLQSCEVLQKAETNELQGFLNTVVKNYETYYVCKSKNDSWIEWYKEASKNYKDATK